MKNLIIVVVLVSFTNHLFAQKECGSPTPRESFYDSSLNRMYAKIKERGQLSTQATTKYIRVIIVDFLSNDGTDSSWSRSEINNEFQLAKDLFKPYDICLELIGVDYIRNTMLQNYNSDVIVPLPSTYNPTALKIYLHKTLTNTQGEGLNGNAFSIISTNTSLSRGAIGLRSMAHEIGHCFGLLHTFETLYGVECPDGSNSTTAGDKITDTRATPDNDAYMNTNTNANCVYTGNLTINCNGATRMYNPEITNIMCYGVRTCRSVFSPFQYNLMHSNLENVSSPLFILNSTLVNNSVISGTSINTDNIFVDAGSLTIGNNNGAIINTFLGFTNKQRYLGAVQVKVTSGTKIFPTSDRCKVIIKTTPICDEIVNYSF